MIAGKAILNNGLENDARCDTFSPVLPAKGLGHSKNLRIRAVCLDWAAGRSLNKEFANAESSVQREIGKLNFIGY